MSIEARQKVAQLAQSINISHKHPTDQAKYRQEIAEILESGEYNKNYPDNKLDLEFWGADLDISKEAVLMVVDDLCVVAAAGLATDEELLAVLALSIEDAKLALADKYEYQTKVTIGRKRLLTFKKK